MKTFIILSLALLFSTCSKEKSIMDPIDIECALPAYTHDSIVRSSNSIEPHILRQPLVDSVDHQSLSSPWPIR